MLVFFGVFEAQEPQTSTLGLSGPAAPPDGPQGLAQDDPENSKRALLITPAFHTQSKFHEKPPRGKKNAKCWALRRTARLSFFYIQVSRRVQHNAM